jgi:DNA-directed RNA polymerase specialized sigma24 family protein
VPFIEVELKDDELDEVVKKLTIYAYSLIPRTEVVRGVGDGPDDLVIETLRRWWDPETKVKWNSDRGSPNLGGIIALLKKVMKNLFLDRLKTADHKRSVATADDPDVPSLTAKTTARQHDADALLARAYLNQLVDRVIPLAEAADDTEVVCYVDLQTKEGGPYKNKDAAERLGVKPSDIVNLRKRLDRYILTARAGAVDAVGAKKA